MNQIIEHPTFGRIEAITGSYTPPKTEKLETTVITAGVFVRGIVLSMLSELEHRGYAVKYTENKFGLFNTESRIVVTSSPEAIRLLLTQLNQYNE